jgi:AcrR family transcriptional regulator
MHVSAAPAPRRSHTVASLLEVATLTFNERGYDGTSMEDLARAAGITKSSIYHHVPGKEALLGMALDRALLSLFAVLDEPAATTGAASDRLEHVLRRSVEVLDAELPSVTLLLRVRGNSPTELDALARRREFDHRVTAIVTAAADEGDLRADVDPSLATRLIFGTVNSLVDWYRPGAPDDGAYRSEVADTVVELVLRGLERPGSAGSPQGQERPPSSHASTSPLRNGAAKW